MSFLNEIDNSNCDDNIDFGPMPVANAFYENQIEHKTFNMSVGYFDSCKLVQLETQPEASDMFNDSYAFITGTSQSMVNHFHNLADKLSERLSWKNESIVMEIGCNDGSFLEQVKKYTKNTIGVEPSDNVAELAREKDIEVYTEFFGSNFSGISTLENKIDTIYAANCICHIPNINDVFSTAEKLLSQNGYFVYEDPYLGSMLSLGSFDQIYDEHTFIFSVTAVSKLAEKHGLKLVDCEWIPTHGGSMRYFITKSNDQIEENVDSWLSYEKIFITTETFSFFKNQIKFAGEVLKKKLTFLKKMNIEVFGFGATSKSTTILNYYGIDKNYITKIYDNSPTKIGCVTPITDIPIVSDKEWENDNPQAIFLFAWNHRKEIEKKYGFSSDMQVLTHLRSDIESSM